MTILAEDLTNAQVLERARLNDLYDETEQTSLSPRVGEVKQAHFAGRPTGGRRIMQRERNPEHDERVTWLFDRLTNGDGSWVFGMLGAKKEQNGDVEFTQKEVLFDYRWGTEINQIMDEQTIVRHDVFGASAALSMSVRQPSIAVEVIKTHYPEEAAFNAFLEKSKREPLIVLFDVIEYKDTSYPNTFVKIDVPRRRLCYRHYTYSIRAGQVFKGNTPTSITTSARLRIEMETMLDAWQKHHAKK